MTGSDMRSAHEIASSSEVLKRQDVSFAVRGQRCAAWLYRSSSRTPRPIIVMAHGLGGVREMRLDAFAERFSRAGYSCLVFDYRHFGASEGEPRQVLEIPSQLEDWAAAVRFARRDTAMDEPPIVLWGTSLSGGHVLTTAARVHGIAAVITQCPFTDGVASGLSLDTTSLMRVMTRAAADKIAAWLGRPPVMVRAAGEPRSAALMTAPDAEPGYLRLAPPGSSLPNEVAARFALDVVRYRPGRRTPDITCPVLFCVCDRDSVAPAKVTLRHARRAARGVIERYPYGHFDIYFGEAFEHIVADEVAFLQRTVPVAA